MTRTSCAPKQLLALETDLTEFWLVLYTLRERATLYLAAFIISRKFTQIAVASKLSSGLPNQFIP